MAVKGNKKQEKEFSKTYGFAPYQVLGVNLSYKALKELGFWVKDEDLESDRDFVGDDEGVPTVMMEFACRATTPGNRLRKFTFWLKKQNDRNKEDSPKGDLFKFINDQGTFVPATGTIRITSFRDNRTLEGEMEFESLDLTGKTIQVKNAKFKASIVL